MTGLAGREDSMTLCFSSQLHLQVIRNSGISHAVVEVPGHNLKKRIQRFDPFKSEVCSRADVCLVCG